VGVLYAALRRCAVVPSRRADHASLFAKMGVMCDVFVPVGVVIVAC
jgi:hypothetical protein